jgi:glycosyltransferase involved in cell wall biosynthesis
MPKISIIVPVYNVERHLRKCLDSIIEQTFNDFECILIDDESYDDCPAICDEYASRDNRIIVIHQKNAGVSAARNAGLDQAQGDWIGFVDSDDWCDPLLFQFLYENAVKTDADISICGWRVFKKVETQNNGDNLFIEEVNAHQRKNTQFEIFDSKSAILKMLDMESFGGYSWNKLTKSEYFINSKIRYNETIKTMSDVLLFYQIFKLAQKIVFSSEPYYNYIQNPESIVHRSGLSKRITGLSVWDKLLSVETDKTIKNKVTMRKIEYASRICYEEVDNYKNDLYYIFWKTAKSNILYLLLYIPIPLKDKLSRIFCLIFPRIYIFLQKKYRLLIRKLS